MGEIKTNKTMLTKYYEDNFQYDDVHSKNIVSDESRIIHSPLSFLLLFKNWLNNVAYGVEQWKK